MDELKAAIQRLAEKAERRRRRSAGQRRGVRGAREGVTEHNPPSPMVAVLYVLERSSGYRGLPGVELWPKSRDARLYAGPHPVIAHPPCGPWSAHLAHAAKRDPKDLAPLAVHQVRRWGGILLRIW